MAINIDSMIHVDCEVQDCSAEFYLNDIPLKFLDANRQLFYTKVAHNFLKAGENSLKIVIFPNQTPSVSQQQYETELPISANAKALMRVVEYKVGATPGELEGATVFKELSVPLSSIEKTDLKPFIFQRRWLMPDRLFPIWHWLSCEPIDIVREQTAIGNFVSRLHHLFVAGRGHELADLAKPQISDMGKAIPARGIQGLYKDLIESVNANAKTENNTSNSDSSVEALQSDLFDHRLCANGTMLQLINKDWRATIRTPEDETGYCYPYSCFIGKIAGKFHVVFSL